MTKTKNEIPFNRRGMNDYVKIVSKKHGMNEKKTRILMRWFLNNFCKKIERGEDIRIPYVGNFYFNKKAHLILKKNIKLKNLKNERKIKS